MFEEGGAWGWIGPRYGQPESLVSLQCLGARVEWARLAPSSAAVWGYVNDDLFSLNASQSGVVKDRRFQDRVEALERRTRDLLQDIASGQARRLRETVGLLSEPDILRYWIEGLTHSAQAEPKASGMFGSALAALEGVDLRRREQTASQVREHGRTTAWLRDSCFRLLRRSAEPVRDPLLKALWEAPLFLTADGGALSFLEIDAKQRDGRLVFSDLPAADQRGRLWCPAPGERQRLQAWLGGSPL